MFQDILLSVINLLIVEPLQADMNERLAAAHAPQVVISEVRTCAMSALPILLDKASTDPTWAATTVIGVWLGTAGPGDVLGTTSSSCEAAIKSATTYLAGRDA